MSDRSRGTARRQSNEWSRQRRAKDAEREVARQAKLASLKAAILAPLPPKKPGELPPEWKAEEEL